MIKKLVLISLLLNITFFTSHEKGSSAIFSKVWKRTFVESWINKGSSIIAAVINRFIGKTEPRSKEQKYKFVLIAKKETDTYISISNLDDLKSESQLTSFKKITNEAYEDIKKMNIEALEFKQTGHHFIFNTSKGELGFELPDVNTAEAFLMPQEDILKLLGKIYVLTH